MGENTQKLVAYLGDPAGYDLGHADIHDVQLAAINERFQEQGAKIKLVALRAKDAV